MLSILIPTYNYNIVALVSEIHQQISTTNTPFEIICLDDASTLFVAENQTITQFSNTNYEILSNNVGRSKIRNLLAQKATYDWLLYLDADVIPKDADFIKRYLPFLNDEIKIVNGGLEYQTEKPEKDKLLRWYYGKEREALSAEKREKSSYISFLTLNFLIHKSLFKQINFNEDIPNMRHEDTLFSYHLMQLQIPIKHINNPIYHLGLDTFEHAMRKEHESLFALKNLLEQHLIEWDYIKISRVFRLLQQLCLVQVVAFFHDKTRAFFFKNLGSHQPSLFIFDIYRLGYLCKLYSSN
jgi:glycosyltransferase involved in cell wall biosynthesis